MAASHTVANCPGIWVRLDKLCWYLEGLKRSVNCSSSESEVDLVVEIRQNCLLVPNQSGLSLVRSIGRMLQTFVELVVSEAFVAKKIIRSPRKLFMFIIKNKYRIKASNKTINLISKIASILMVFALARWVVVLSMVRVRNLAPVGMVIISDALEVLRNVFRIAVGVVNVHVDMVTFSAFVLAKL